MNNLFKSSFKGKRLDNIEGEETKSFRNKLVNISLFAFGFLSIPTVIFSILETRVTGWSLGKYIQIVAVAFVFIFIILRNKLSFRIKANTVITFLSILGFLSISTLGPNGMGPIFMLLAITLASLYFDSRGGTFILVGSGLVYIIVSLLYVNGILHVDFDLNQSPLDFYSWFSDILLFVLISGLLIFTISRINDRLLSNIQSITHSKERLNIANQKALASQKAKNEFLDNMSHEIRTPLNAITGYTSLLSSRISDQESLNFVNEISESSNKLLKMINTILDLSALETGSFEANLEYFECKKFFEEISSQYRELANNKNVEFEAFLPEEFNQLLYLDKIRLSVALGAILENAVKFTDKGKIDFIFSYQISESDQLVDIKYEITDTGKGIKPEFLEISKESFSQEDGSVSRDFEGLGIGLSLSNKLIQRLGGALVIDSKIGEGTKVVITIPSVKYKKVETDESMADSFVKDIIAGKLILPKEVEIMFLEQANTIWVDLMHRQAINKVKEFGKLMKTHGDEYNVSQISEYGNNILDAVKAFDIDRILVLIKVYPELLKNLNVNPKSEE